MSLAAKLPYSHPYANGFGYGGTNVPTDTDGLDYLSRMATADGAGLETGIAGAIDRFIKACKTNSVWDSIRASCILAGARSLDGALVPLKNEGPELWGTASPGSALISDNGSGVATTWDEATLTFTCDDTYTTSYPRIAIPISGIDAGKQYRLSGRVSGDPASVLYIAVDNTGSSTVSVNASTGEFNGTSTAAGVVPYVTIATNGSTGPLSVTIESLSIREVIDDPINSPVGNGFVEGDYSRTDGLTGDGTSYIDSGRANDDDPQDDNHNSIYLTQAYSNGSTFEIGASTSAGRNAINVAANVFTRCRDATEINTGISSGTNGLVGFSRNSSAGYAVRAYGSDYSATAPSDGLASDNVFVFAGNNGGSPVVISSATLAFYSIGTDIGSAGLTALDTAVSNLMADITFFFNTGLNPADYDTETVRYVNAGYAAGGTLE